MKKIFNTFTEICEPLTDYGNFVCQSIFISLLFTKKKSLYKSVCLFSNIYIEPNGSPV